MTITEETRATPEQIAYQQGRRDADVDARLYGHEKRLNAINGSIEKHAKNAAKLEQTMDKRCDSIEDKIDSLITAQKARDAVEADREEQDDRSAKKLFSRRTIQAAFLTIAVMLLAVIVSVVALALTVH